MARGPLPLARPCKAWLIWPGPQPPCLGRPQRCLCLVPLLRLGRRSRFPLGTLRPRRRYLLLQFHRLLLPPPLPPPWSVLMLLHLLPSSWSEPSLNWTG